jgi:WhiB family redox-sensing transcriptional regulator
VTTKWRDYADCRYEDPELFFPDSYRSGPGLYQAEEAKAVCRRCPVKAECLAHALTIEDGKSPDGRHGIRAALTPSERYTLATGRRARTRTTQAA